MPDMNRRTLLKLLLLALATPGCGGESSNGAALPATDDDASIAARVARNFKTVYGDPELKTRFLDFLTNVFHLYPEQALHALIAEVVAAEDDGRRIYRQLAARIPEIKPFLSELSYALPALEKQKLEMLDQVARLIDDDARFEGYIEIGTPGRHVGDFRERLGLQGPVWLVNDYEPGYSPLDLVERGQFGFAGAYLPLDNYAPVDTASVPGGVDLVSNFIGLHHAPRERLGDFVDSIRDVLRPGGIFILRDHDVDDARMDALVGLAHDVYNAGTGQEWGYNAREFRQFLPLAQLEAFMRKRGFHREGPLLTQAGDPTRNTLMRYRKV